MSIKKDGYALLLVIAFLLSWTLQLIAQMPKIEQEGMAEFWSATFENWQSEFLQLFVQVMLVGVLADRIAQRYVRSQIEDTKVAIREALDERS